MTTLFIFVLSLSACSSLQKLDKETRVLGAALATAAVMEATNNTNYGVTHGVISYGVSHATETFADQLCLEFQQEWPADLLAIVGAAAPALYYHNRESGRSADSKADWLLPLGNLAVMTHRRLSRRQCPAPLSEARGAGDG